MNTRGGGATSGWPKARIPFLGDVAVVVVVAIIAIVAVAAGSSYHGEDFSSGDLVGAAIAIPLVVLLWRAPIAALGLTTLATVITIAVTGQRSVAVAAVVFLLYRVASRTDRRSALIGAAAAAATIYGVSLAFLDDVSIDRDIDVAAWSILAVAIGDAVRNRRAYLREVEARAQRAEESREEEARRRVVEERLRIARELHDLVAHRMAVINVQAGVAAHVLRASPDEAEDALTIVRDSASEVLGELGEILSVLRNVDDPEAPVEPTPTLRALGPLVASFTAAGLDVTWRSSGTLEGLPDSIQLAVFRLVQEGLTNARRHGDGHATLDVERSNDAVEVTISNRVGSGNDDASAGSGFGLVGMRERVSAVGGTLEIGPTDDGRFRLVAHIPTTGRRPT